LPTATSTPSAGSSGRSPAASPPAKHNSPYPFRTSIMCRVDGEPFSVLAFEYRTSQAHSPRVLGDKSRSAPADRARHPASVVAESSAPPPGGRGLPWWCERRPGRFPHSAGDPVARRVRHPYRYSVSNRASRFRHAGAVVLRSPDSCAEACPHADCGLRSIHLGHARRQPPTDHAIHAGSPTANLSTHAASTTGSASPNARSHVCARTGRQRQPQS
jgi:hypothetical protein